MGLSEKRGFKSDDEDNEDDDEDDEYDEYDDEDEDDAAAVDDDDGRIRNFLHFCSFSNRYTKRV